MLWPAVPEQLGKQGDDDCRVAFFGGGDERGGLFFTSVLADQGWKGG